MSATFTPRLHPHARDGRFRDTFHMKAANAPQFGDTRPDLIGSPGRSGKGRLRNFGAMTDEKLIGVLGALTTSPIHDPDAIHAAQVEAARRTGRKLTEAARRAGMRSARLTAKISAAGRQKLVQEALMTDRERAMARRVARVEERLIEEAAEELAEFGFAERLHPRGPGGKWIAGVSHGLHEFHVEGKAVGGVHETPQGIHAHYAGKKLHDTKARVGRDHKYPWKRFKSVKAARKAVEQEHSYTVREAADSLAKASTPEPFSTSKTSNWVARGGGLPDYIQHVAHGLVRRGMAESKAIEMAIGIVKRWARGGGNVDAGTKAAAAKAVAEWEALKAKNAAKHAAKAAS